MNAILSMLIAMAMLVTGGAGAANITVGNVKLDVNDQHAELDLTATAGIEATEDSALIDFHIDDADSQYLPMQALITADGISVTACGSDVYTLTADLLATLGELDEETEQFYALYNDLMQRELRTEQPDPEKIREVLDTYIAPLTENAPMTEATVSLPDSDEVLPATKITFAIDHDTFCGLIESIYASAGLEELLTQISSVAGSESFTALLTDNGIELTTLCAVTKADDSDYELIEMECTFEITEDSEVTTFTMPIVIEAVDEDTVNARVFVESEPTISYDYTFAMDGSDYTVATSMSLNLLSAQEAEVSSSDGHVEINYNLTHETVDTGATDTLDLAVSSDDLMLTVSTEKIDNTTSVVLSYTDDGFNTTTLSFDLTQSNDPITNRIDGANTIVINSEEDLSMLSAMAASMFGDVTRLTENEQVMAMVNMYAFPMEDPEITTVVDDKEYEYSENLADLSFGVPTFHSIPDGFEVSDTSCFIDDFTQTLYVNFADTAGSDSVINLTIEKVDIEGTYTNYVIHEDGTYAPETEPVVTIYDGGDWYDVSTRRDGFSIGIYGYGEKCNADNLMAMLMGIEF